MMKSYNLRTVDVAAASKHYKIGIGSDWINADFLRTLVSTRKAVVITDENVFGHYKDLLEGFDVFVIKPGEPSKNMDYYAEIQRYIIGKHLTRTDCIIALGGGVVGDLAGFIAATYMRGIGFIQIPTTLLAMVDSSVGGKVAINHGSGKNILGTFYQPDAVHIDVAFLKTLPAEEYACGMAEVLKYGLIRDAALFDLLASQTPEATREGIADVVKRCCEIKAEIVSMDEEDKGIRQILNFGHTIGHAIEAYYKYEGYTHGQGVAIGMAMKATLSKRQGHIDATTEKRIHDVLTQYDLPLGLKIPEDFKPALTEIIHDKKAEGQTFKLIELKAIGEVDIASYIFEDLLKMLENNENGEE